MLTAVLMSFICCKAQTDWRITRFVMHEGEPSWNLNWREEKAGQVEQQCTCDCKLHEQEENLPECPRRCRGEWDQRPLPDDVASGSLVMD